MADTLEELARRWRAMRELPDDVRAKAIVEAPNVIGFERFDLRAHEVQSRDAYGDLPTGAPRMTRVRSAAQRAPQTKDQALTLAARFAAIASRMGEIGARRASIHAKVDAICDADMVPLAAEQADIVKQLKPWFAANQQALCGDKRKSIELGGCVIGYRISPPAVTFAGGKDDFAVAALVEARLDSDLVRTKLSPDKPAILKLLELATPEQAPAEPDPKLALKTKLEELGFAIKQAELFFVDLATKSDAPQAVDALVDGAA